MRTISTCGICRSRGQNPIQPLVAQGQRIAAGNQHVADAGRGPDVLERLLQPLLPRGDMPLPHHPRARAVAAIARTEIGHQQQHAVGIAMHQARHGAVVVFAQGIVGLAGRTLEFIQRGNDRPPQRLEAVVARNQAHVIGGNAHREHGSRLRQGRPLVRRKLQNLFELVQGADSVAGLPIPGVPLLVGDAGIEGFAENLGSKGASRHAAGQSAGDEKIAFRIGTLPFRRGDGRRRAREQSVDRTTGRLFFAIGTRFSSFKAGHSGFS